MRQALSKPFIFAILFLVALMGVAAGLGGDFHLWGGLLLMVGAIGTYFFLVFVCEDRNFLGLRALFAPVWVFTIGLAQLRLLGYQKPWQVRTWCALILAMVVFELGLSLGKTLGMPVALWLKERRGKRVGNFRLKFRPERLFWLCIGVSAVGLFSFIMSYLCRGYLPFFTTSSQAYLTYYSKWVIFVVASAAASPLAYYCIKQQELSRWKKALLWICIFNNTFAYPILMVNRGVFICAALMLTCAVFYLNKQRFWVLCLCLVVILGMYEVGAVARSYTNEYLDYVFEPSEIKIQNVQKDPVKDDHSSDLSKDPINQDVGNLELNKPEDDQALTFQLSPQTAFLYAYLTVSHDNFNEAILNANELTFGLRQLEPFNVILRSKAIENAIEDSEYYMVKDGLTTVNLFGDAYYDLREVGILLLGLIWAIVLGILEQCYLKNRGPFALAALGNALTPAVLCFFSTWFANFTFWMFWGLILLLWIGCCVSRKKRKDRQ